MKKESYKIHLRGGRESRTVEGYRVTMGRHVLMVRKGDDGGGWITDHLATGMGLFTFTAPTRKALVARIERDFARYEVQIDRCETGVPKLNEV